MVLTTNHYHYTYPLMTCGHSTDICGHYTDRMAMVLTTDLFPLRAPIPTLLPDLFPPLESSPCSPPSPPCLPPSLLAQCAVCRAREHLSSFCASLLRCCNCRETEIEIERESPKFAPAGRRVGLRNLVIIVLCGRRAGGERGEGG